MSKVNIRVSGVESKTFDNGGMGYTIVDGKKKYKFYNKRKDGEITKAYEGFEKLKLRIGDDVDAEVEEEDKTFVNDSGKTINYVDRRVKFFYTDGENMATAQSPKATVTQPTDVEERFKALEKRIDFLEEHLYPGDVKTPTEKPPVITPQFPPDEYVDESKIKIEDVPF